MTNPTKRRPRINAKPLARTEVKRFETLRLTRRWSYRELAADVSRVCGVAMPENTLRRALVSDGPVRPTTSHPLRKYLAQLPHAEVA